MTGMIPFLSLISLVDPNARNLSRRPKTAPKLIFRAIARPAEAVVKRFEERKPRRGGIQENAPDAATMRQP
jgi:hypothetical protein